MLPKNLSQSYKLLALSLLLMPARPLHADTERNILIGAALAGIGFMTWGINKLFKSSSHSSAQHRLDETQKTLHAAQRFEGLCELVAREYETEQRLQAIANNLPMSTPVQDVARQLSSTIDTLRNDKKFITKNLMSWQKDEFYADLIPLAHDVERTVDTQLVKLERLLTCLNKHRTYFHLASMCQKMHNNYQDELKACSSKLSVYPDQEIKKVALAKDLSARNGFPLITYIERLDPQTQDIESQLAHLPQNAMYKELIHEATLLKTRLNYIKQTIAQDQEYQRQRSEYARFQQDERLVQARLKEVEELSRKNRLEEERIKEDRRKYDIHQREVRALEDKAQHARRIAQHMPSLENLFLEIQRAIRHQKRIIAELHEQISRSAGISPQCAEYQEIRRQIHEHERKLEELYDHLDRLLNRVKREA